MRCISWMMPYKEKYERFLNTGNANTDASNAILLHSEGDGKSLPSLFVVSDQQSADSEQPTVPPPMPGMAVPPPLNQQAAIEMYFNIGGQNYGPYDYATCRQFKENRQINENTMAWQKGMAAWLPAGQIAELKPLFAPQMPPAPPQMPPAPTEMPPMPPAAN